MSDTRTFLLDHAARYPMAAAQDYMKALFQSAFGCEHLIADASAAAAYIRREAGTALPHAGETVEPLDGPYCRVHLDVLRDGLTPETMAALFALSAEHQPDGPALLEAKLGVLQQLIGEGLLPLDAADTAARIDAWRSAGFPACHHSDAFRAAYAPAYRLMKATYAHYLPLFAHIDRAMAAAGPVTVVIDGGSATGKTTLAALLQKVYGCNVFHMDDFFLRPEQRTPERYAEPGGNVDRERFLAEVLTPLRAGQPVAYRPFDCHTMTVQPAQTIQPTRLTVIEGAYSLHPALRADGDLHVFLRIDPALQRRRIEARNGAEMVRRFAEQWIPLEQVYFEAHDPEECCQLVFEAVE